MFRHDALFSAQPYRQIREQVFDEDDDDSSDEHDARQPGNVARQSGLAERNALARGLGADRNERRGFRRKLDEAELPFETEQRRVVALDGKRQTESDGAQLRHVVERRAR
jgi:hypothetical protein